MLRITASRLFRLGCVLFSMRHAVVVRAPCSVCVSALFAKCIDALFQAYVASNQKNRGKIYGKFRAL